MREVQSWKWRSDESSEALKICKEWCVGGWMNWYDMSGQVLNMW